MKTLCEWHCGYGIRQIFCLKPALVAVCSQADRFTSLSFSILISKMEVIVPTLQRYQEH